MLYYYFIVITELFNFFLLISLDLQILYSVIKLLITNNCLCLILVRLGFQKTLISVLVIYSSFVIVFIINIILILFVILLAKYRVENFLTDIIFGSFSILNFNIFIFINFYLLIILLQSVILLLLL